MTYLSRGKRPENGFLTGRLQLLRPGWAFTQPTPKCGNHTLKLMLLVNDFPWLSINPSFNGLMNSIPVCATGPISSASSKSETKNQPEVEHTLHDSTIPTDLLHYPTMPIDPLHPSCFDYIQ
jgi:hypothetical protein